MERATGLARTDEVAVHRPCVRVRVEIAGRSADEVGLAELEHGDLVGRLWSAALPLDHPSVSEAHALVSLRDGTFWLLALRRRLAVDGVVRSEVALRPGLRVALADGVVVVVEDLVLPDRVLALRAPGLPPVVLPSVCSVRGAPAPVVVGRFDPTAPCVVWTAGAGWRMVLHGHERTLGPGDAFEVDGVRFEAILQGLGGAGPGVTRVAGGIDPPVLLVTSFDTVQIHRGDDPPLVVGGVQARILCELASFGGPVDWQVVAGEIWPDDVDGFALRKRWDVALARMRARLRGARVRPDLIASDGKGAFELVLRPGDRVEDRS